MNVLVQIIVYVIVAGAGYYGGRFHEAYLNTNAREARQLKAMDNKLGKTVRAGKPVAAVLVKKPVRAKK